MRNDIEKSLKIWEFVEDIKNLKCVAKKKHIEEKPKCYDGWSEEVN